MSQPIRRLLQTVFALGFAFLGASCAPKATPLATAPTGILPMPSPQGVAMVARLPRPYNTGNISKGRALFAECAQCHSLDRNGSETKGPTLYGVFQRHSAEKQHYSYSEALRHANIVWDARHLDQWIFNPHETFPGTTMSYIGVRNDSKRYDILAYLIAVTSYPESDRD